MGREYTYTIDGRPWLVKWVPRSRLPPATDGITYRETRRVLLANDLPPELETRVLAHELGHARFWDLDEEAVEDFAAVQSAAFWDCIGGT
ncbi:MAG TPA: ImmA/IrrE family metallo-endopeptidase [Phycisphaerae bacterium]|nr:ImmA/IrrE family metallo-endopeptidase [Phycisphaerae bacterium]